MPQLAAAAVGVYDMHGAADSLCSFAQHFDERRLHVPGFIVGRLLPKNIRHGRFLPGLMHL